MPYLLIVLVLFLILSPLVWFKPSARQKMITNMRREAAKLGLQVTLSKPPAAREGEGRLEYTRYLLRWKQDSKLSPEKNNSNWLLVKGSKRGDKSSWGNWHWISREASIEIQSGIGVSIKKLPENVSGLEANKDGLAVYWKEQGELESVQTIAETLQELQTYIRTQ